MDEREATRTEAVAQDATTTPTASSAPTEVQPLWADAQDDHVRDPATSTPDPELADLVIIDFMLAKYGDREPSRVDMSISGLDQQTIDAAITSWEALDKPETAGEREARHRLEQAAQTTAELPQVVLEKPEPIVEQDQQPEHLWAVSEIPTATEAAVQPERIAQGSVEEQAHADAMKKVEERYRRHPELRGADAQESQKGEERDRGVADDRQR